MGDHDMNMSTDIYINAGLLQTITRQSGDLTGVPPDASLIDAAAWAIMCQVAGGEKELIAALGLRDVRGEYA